MAACSVVERVLQRVRHFGVEIEILRLMIYFDVGQQVLINGRRCLVGDGIVVVMEQGFGLLQIYSILLLVAGVGDDVLAGLGFWIFIVLIVRYCILKIIYLYAVSTVYGIRAIFHPLVQHVGFDFYQVQLSNVICFKWLNILTDFRE